jgi:2-pyrone-4,6-dicarboxylate lactonase
MTPEETPRFIPPQAPAKALPRGACDTHAHVFGPYDRFPLAEPRPYTPAPAPKEHYLAMLDAVGLDSGVLVQGGANGWDHRAMLDTIATRPDRLRGIGVLPAGASDAELAALATGGVRGLRFTEVAGPTASQKFPGRVGFDALYELAPRLRKLRWQAVIWANADALAAADAALRDLEIPLVIDHLGYFDVTRGVDDPSFLSVVSLVRDGVAWVKLTAFRNSKIAPHHEDVRPFHDALVRANPDRLLWGSDWPYLGMNAYRPDVGALLDLLDDWLRDDSLRQKVLVSNPAALYGFA